MTTFRTTLETYKTGAKGIAFSKYKADINSRQNISFETFCNALDKIIKENNSKSINHNKVNR
tara:strand:- start:145 stop:330 length:186 start_codon:yes stop_codon:yes gene_type:complete